MNKATNNNRKIINSYRPKVLSTIILALLAGLLSFSAYSSCTIPNPSKTATDFNKIITNLESYDTKPGDKNIYAEFISEIQQIHSHLNPEVDSNLKYVWVLSARYSYRKTRINPLAQDINGADINDGYDRMRLGISIARQATAKNLNKLESALTDEDIEHHGPIILFNGVNEDNEVLQDVLSKGEIKDYPKEKFYIFSLPEGEMHTGGQFIALKQQFEQGKIDLTNAKIAIVTHAYHWPRTGRYIGNKPGFDTLYQNGASVTAYLVDRQFYAPGVEAELKQEMLKLPGYIAKGFILPTICTGMQCNYGAR